MLQSMGLQRVGHDLYPLDASISSSLVVMTQTVFIHCSMSPKLRTTSLGSNHRCCWNDIRVAEQPGFTTDTLYDLE